jgi:hypothetical protein
MPKIAPAMHVLRDECVRIVDQLVNECEVQSIRAGFERVYYMSKACRTSCGFDSTTVEKAYQNFKWWRFKTTIRSTDNGKPATE